MQVYDMAKRNYDRGLWTTLHLEKLVAVGKLTQEEMERIIAEKEANE